jgi:hypothetical protein
MFGRVAGFVEAFFSATAAVGTVAETIAAIELFRNERRESCLSDIELPLPDFK